MTLPWVMLSSGSICSDSCTATTIARTRSVRAPDVGNPSHLLLAHLSVCPAALLTLLKPQELDTR